MCTPRACLEPNAAPNTMDDTKRQLTPVSHVGRKVPTVVPVLLFFSLGFALGMISNSNIPNFFYDIPFVLPPPAPPPPPTLSPPPPSPRPPTIMSAPLQSPQVVLTRELAPSSVVHNMTDEELFWWASMAPKVRSTPYPCVPKVAFLFLVRGGLPLRPLWEKFFAGHEGLYSIYVHTDPLYTGSPPKDSVFNGRIIPSQVTKMISSRECTWKPFSVHRQKEKSRNQPDSQLRFYLCLFDLITFLGIRTSHAACSLQRSCYIYVHE
jgi:hypothetical protein